MLHAGFVLTLPANAVTIVITATGTAGRPALVIEYTPVPEPCCALALSAAGVFSAQKQT